LLRNFLLFIGGAKDRIYIII